MSQRAVTRLSELGRHGGGWVVARCECGRRVKFLASHLAAYCHARRISDHWPDFAVWLRCRCGARRPSVRWSGPGDNVDDIETVQVPSPAPAGVSQKAWHAADERGRRRLIRIVRD